MQITWNFNCTKRAKEVTHNRTTDYIIHSARILSNY